MKSSSSSSSKKDYTCNPDMTSRLRCKDENKNQSQGTVMNQGTWQKGLVLLFSLLSSLTVNSTNQSKSKLFPLCPGLEHSEYT